MSSIDTSAYPGAFDTDKFFFPASNNIETTLVTYIAPNQINVINVASTAGFPNEGVISIDKEVIFYRSKTQNSFKFITRGYDGTTAFQHNTGALVQLRFVAAHHNRLKNAIKSIERTLGIDPQGSYPDLATRLQSMFSSVNKRTSQVLLKSDLTPTETGYSGGANLARMFKTSERFIKVPKFGPVVYVDGIAQIQNEPIFLVSNAVITSIDVNNAGSGVITCSSASFLGSGATVGDLVIIKGTPNNNDAYIISSVVSNTQINVSQVIFGTDQISAVGTLDIVDVSNIISPFKDVICIPTGFTSSDEGDSVIFLNPPDLLQNIRIDYEIKNTTSTAIYSNPIAVLADYQSPTYSGTVSANGNETATLNIGKSRGLVFKIILTANSTPSTNVKIELFGKSDFSERQYLAEYVDLTLEAFVDNGVWHFENKDSPMTTHIYAKITDMANQSFTYTLTLEAEALGINV